MYASAITWGTSVGPTRSEGGRVLQTERTDEELFERFRRGERRALELLLARHRAPLFTFVLHLVGNGDRARAEDIVQDTFVRVIKGASGWQERARFSTWLFTIARNLVFDLRRRDVHRRVESLDAGNARPALGEILRATEPSPEAHASDGRLRQAIGVAMERLSEEQREVFVLREGSGLSFRDIAEVQGVGENTVKSRMRYALESLRRSLSELGFDEPSLREGA